MTTYICPICGTKIPSKVVAICKASASIFCFACGNWVLPLATPQKEEEK